MIFGIGSLMTECLLIVLILYSLLRSSYLWRLLPAVCVFSYWKFSPLVNVAVFRVDCSWKWWKSTSLDLGPVLSNDLFNLKGDRVCVLVNCSNPWSASYRVWEVKYREWVLLSCKFCLNSTCARCLQRTAFFNIIFCSEFSFSVVMAFLS